MTNLSTVPYNYEPGLIARLLGVVLEAAHAYGVRLLRIRTFACHSHLSIAIPKPVRGSNYAVDFL